MIQQWLFSVAARKVVMIAVKAACAFLAGATAQHYLTNLGVTYDPTKLQEGLTLACLGAIEGLHDLLKVKFPNTVTF